MGARYRVEAPGYIAAHMRVGRARGSASTQLCGCGEPAQEWSYTHADPAELSEVDVRTGRPRYYSANPVYYVALCKPCHRAVDRDYRLGLASA